MARWNRWVAVLLCAGVLTAALSGCSGARVTTETRTQSLKSEAPAKPSASVAWSHVFNITGEPEVLFIIRVKNTGDKPLSGLATNVNALDKTGTIVGSTSVDFPTIPASSSFDLVGRITGGGGKLTGTPDKVEMGDVSTGNSSREMIKSSEVKLTKKDQPFSEAPYEYAVMAKVTNDGDHALTGGMHQVILYDAAGNPVGAFTQFMLDMPDTFAPGASYREQFRVVPASAPAKSAQYSAWSIE